MNEITSDDNYTTDNTTFYFDLDNVRRNQLIITNPAVQVLFYIVYSTIFTLGLVGNALVCFVVLRKKEMQSVTNFFITNLALSDILQCVLAVPFTPIYSFLGEWIFGAVLCHLVPFAQGVSVYISTLTLTSIAVDRFFVIIYPFKERMKYLTCFTIIGSIWVFSMLATLPYGLLTRHAPKEGDNQTYYCDEEWPNELSRRIFSASTTFLQFVVPFIIIACCYIRVSIKLGERAKYKPGTKSFRKEQLDRERKRRTNRMLIAMVTVFGCCWLPLNLTNLVHDVYVHMGHWKYYQFCFFIAHAIAMSSICYNPFLYAWLNENFRKEFKHVLPCFLSNTQSLRDRVSIYKTEKSCNGNETLQEELLATTASSVKLQVAHVNEGSSSVVVVYNTASETVTSNPGAEVVGNNG